jgi:hypothetical protein
MLDPDERDATIVRLLAFANGEDLEDVDAFLKALAELPSA